MFAYRHAFHAGNHADVIKHALALGCLKLMQQKEAAVMVVDSHAGSGLYRIGEALMRGRGEFPTGLAKLWPYRTAQMPELVQDYLQFVAGFNSSRSLEWLPGSPVMLARSLRSHDLLYAYEMHPSDHPLLQTNLSDYGRRVKSFRSDGFQSVMSLLPTVSKRAMFLVDPPYEDKRDYERTFVMVRDGLQRMSNTCFVVWIPMIARYDVERLLKRLQALAGEKLRIDLCVQPAALDGLGLTGSHVLVFNPPFGLQALCDEALPWLFKKLVQTPLDQAKKRGVLAPHFKVSLLPSQPLKTIKTVRQPSLSQTAYQRTARPRSSPSGLPSKPRARSSS
ncbi:MAG: 23S rRNA (adenine(2030)-N(6))-methyltransferase RlmJ [Burkholderiaceae bacterium]|jgi:23S rRNA (adenine2030-N6)-methyltransferase